MRTGFAVNITNNITPPPVCSLHVFIHQTHPLAILSDKGAPAAPRRHAARKNFSPVSKLDAPQTGVCRFIFAHLPRDTKRRCVDKYIPQSGGFFVNG